MSQGMQGDISQFFGGQGFDPNSVTPAEDFDVLPTGRYPVLIEKAEMKETKAGTGHYLGLQLLVLDGPCKGRKLFDNLNIDNPDAKCVEIALRALSALCKATIGDVAFSNENQLLNQSCMAHVKVGKDGTNSIRTYSRVGDAQAVQSAAPPTGPPAVLQQAPLVHQQSPPAVQTRTAEGPLPDLLDDSRRRQIQEIVQPPSAVAPVERDSVAAPPGAGLTAAPAVQPKVPWAGQQSADTPPAAGGEMPF